MTARTDEANVGRFGIVLVVLVLGGFVGGGYWVWSRTQGAGDSSGTETDSQNSSEPAEDLADRKFAPRERFDTSGFQLVGASIPKWDRRASLPEIARAWRAHITRSLDMLEPALKAKGPIESEQVRSMVVLAMLLDYEGQPIKAYSLLEKIRERVKLTRAVDDEWRYSLIFWQGVVSIRLGEDDNCLANPADGSCILPFLPSAVHANPRGSRQAIKHFTEYIERFPDDLGCRWLLNLAHMTLGEHPRAVDPKYLLTIDEQENSEAAIGEFLDVAHLVGTNRLNQAGGAVMDDFDGDGWLDLINTSFDPTQPMMVYRNNQRGAFTECTAAAGVTDQLGGLYCVQADFNEDGFLDLFVARGAWLLSPIRPSLLRNNGDGTFTDITESAELMESANSNSASWGDFDNDGLLDLYVCCERQSNRLYRNRGDGTFENVAAKARVVGSQKPLCKGAVWIDFDNDRDLDLFLNYFGGSAMLFRNEGGGVFVEATQELGIDGPDMGFSCWAWDYDNDGWLDLWATCYDQTLDDVVRGLLHQPHERKSNRLFHNVGGTRFENKTKEAGLDVVHAAMGSNFADFDNDGYLDMYLGTGEPRLEILVPNRMIRNMDGAKFLDITSTSRTGHLQKGHAVACGDWNRDGQVDLFIEMGGASNGDRARNQLFQNPGHKNAWVAVRCIGDQSNRSSMGARIQVVTRGANPRTIHRHVTSGSTFGANTLEQTIGLGDAQGIERIEVHWPQSDCRQVVQDVPLGHVVTIRESAGVVGLKKFEPVQPQKTP